MIDVASLSGRQFLEAVRDGLIPSPPFLVLLGGEIDTIEEGRVVFRGQPGPQHYNPIGSVHGGYAATFLDSCMSCAIHSTLAPGLVYTTLEFKLNLVRPLSDRSGTIRAEGKIIHVGSRVGTAEGKIFDESGKLCAHGTVTCLIFPRNA
jgi:uncharacterized protein (TIGR00369 family)